MATIMDDYAEMHEHVKQIRKVRKGRLTACTRKMNDLKRMMQEEDVNAVHQHLVVFQTLVGAFKSAHEAVLNVLTEEEKETDTAEWYEPRVKPFQEFLHVVGDWEASMGPQSELEQQELPAVENEEYGDSVAALEQQEDELEPPELDLQNLINPNDSISNVGKSKSSSKSSSVTSAHRKALADQAALLARREALHAKHALEQQRLILNSKIEDAELEADIAASDAKIKVLESFDMQSGLSASEDGMNSYLESHRSYLPPSKQRQSPVEFARIATLPKTPLQTLMQQPRPATAVTTTKQPGAIPKHPISTPKQSVTIAQPPINVNPKQEKISLKISSQRPFLTKPSPDYVGLSSVMQRQNEIVDLLVLQHKQGLLPVRDIPVFHGDPLSYTPFMRAFEYSIEDKTLNNQDRLYYLEQYTTGQPRELVRSCFHMDPSRGYPQAKRLLQENFGDELKVTMAYMDKALKWTNIKTDDGKDLQSYALYLRGCCNTMQDLRIMEELDLPSNMKLIITKLPYKLKEKWRSTACDILEKTGHRARFHNLVAFMEKQAKNLLDPLFGDILDHNRTKSAAISKQPSRPRSYGNSFATTVAVLTDEGDIRPNAKDKTFKCQNILDSCASCAFCEGKHYLKDCQKLKTQPRETIVEFLKTKGFCFGCLLRGHMSKDCKRRMTCERCQSKHPTILHFDRVKPFEPVKSRETSINSGQVTLKPGGVTWTGKDCALSIVPVQVKATKGSKSVLTYAFLDPGSSGTFCTERLRRQLNARGRKTEILLRTMGQVKTVSSYELSGLEVGNLEGNTFIELPKVYTQDAIPVTKENVATQKDISNWPYLEKVRLNEIDADIDLLIGANSPRALEPWQIINAEDNGPYAVKTVFGWVINGPLDSCTAEETSRLPVLTANHISVTELKDLLLQQYNHDFPERKFDEKNEMSAEDHKFMKSAKSSVMLKNGHYYMSLPLRDRNVMMPNNRDVAKKRTLNLIRKFKSDPGYALEYRNFMSDVIQKGYAEMVPQDMLQRQDGKVWYIPHHAVYHKRKKTLRVVFDCSSKFQHASLNDELFQGPDLANPLLAVLLRFRQEPIAMMADIEGMFHQVRVLKEDRDLLRFLWWPDGDTSKNLQEYRMTVHLFGAISSPTCANFALRKTADDHGHGYAEEVSRTIKCNFYVDDCLKSVATEDQAINLCKDLRDLCSQGGFKLTKWICNSRSVLASIQDEYKAKQIKELDLDREKLPLERALGVQWNIEKDTFIFRVTRQDRPLTRRGILSFVSSIYDPLGFLAPFIQKTKQILQDLCKLKCGWDDSISET